MTRNTPNRSVIAALLAFSGVLAGFSPALAQGSPDATEPPLKGPPVTDRNVPGAAPDFGMGPAANGRRAERVPPEVFRRSLAVLTADDAPAAIRATPEQRTKFREWVDGFEASARKFRREHAKEIASLREAAGEAGAGGGGGRGAGVGRGRGDDRGAAPARPMQPMEDLTPERQKAREEARVKLRDLMAAAPKIEDVYTKVWTELSEPQRVAVQAELDEWRGQQSKRREEEYVRRRVGSRNQPPPPPAGSAPRARTDATDDGMTASKDGMEKNEAAPSRDGARRQRLIRLFNQLSPEDQERLLQRLEARSQERRRENGGADRAAPKAPADPERVKVPSPD